VLLTSNPRNPTGQVLEGEDLKDVQDLCRDKCTLIVDEFYSGYLYTHGCNGETVSSAEYVDDVNEDPVIIVNGLTKIFRLPGFRICWVVGPKDLVKALSRSGSYLDGGASHVLQDAAVQFVKPDLFTQEMKALQQHFVKKRDYVVERLNEMGIKTAAPDATFYIWVNLSHLPEKIHSGLSFFEACLEEKVIVVPGLFFDINPKNRRDLSHSPCHHFIRLSFGPPLEELKRGLDGIERVLAKYGVHPTKK
jgi:aspartate/methionine/tyrosine aminotransferase